MSYPDFNATINNRDYTVIVYFGCIVVESNHYRNFSVNGIKYRFNVTLYSRNLIDENGLNSDGLAKESMFVNKYSIYRKNPKTNVVYGYRPTKNAVEEIRSDIITIVKENYDKIVELFDVAKVQHYRNLLNDASQDMKASIFKQLCDARAELKNFVVVDYGVESKRMTYAQAVEYAYIQAEKKILSLYDGDYRLTPRPEISDKNYPFYVLRTWDKLWDNWYYIEVREVSIR